MVDVGLEQYTASLQQVAVLRLLQQLSQVYSVMRVDSLEALVPFMGFSDVEQLIVDAVKHDFLQVGDFWRALTSTCLGHFCAPPLMLFQVLSPSPPSLGRPNTFSALCSTVPHKFSTVTCLHYAGPH